jgi:hypothetical protein
VRFDLVDMGGRLDRAGSRSIAGRRPPVVQGAKRLPGYRPMLYDSGMTTRPARLLIAATAALCVALLGGAFTVLAASSRPLVSGPVSEGPRADDRGIERFLLPAGRYTYKDENGWLVESSFCGPRLLLGVRDGDGWLLSDGGRIGRFAADARIAPLAPARRSIHLRVALYTDPRRADEVSLAAAHASIREFLPLYASLYTGGALTLEIEDAGELTPDDTTHSASGVTFTGPDLLGVRRAAGDDRVGLLLSPARRNEPVRGLAYFDLFDSRPGAYTTYTTWFRKADLWRETTGRSLDATLSLDDLAGRELLELLTATPEEINDPAAIAWHELLHVLEWRAHPVADLHDWTGYGHAGVQDLWFADSRAVERSWYGLMSWSVLGESLVERGSIEPGCYEPMGSAPRP